MKFIVCPSQCTADVDSNDFLPEVKTDKSAKHRRPVANQKGKASSSVSTEKKKPKRLQNVLQTLKLIAFGKPKKLRDERKNLRKPEVADAYTETPRLIRSSVIKDLTKTERNETPCQAIPVLRIYSSSPRKIGSENRKHSRENLVKTPPQKPKRINGRKCENRKSPLLVVKKPGLRSPVVARGSPLKTRKFREKSNRRFINYYNETSFLSAIAEERSCK